MKFGFSAIKPTVQEEPKKEVLQKKVVGIITWKEDKYVFTPLKSSIAIPISKQSYSCKGFHIIYTDTGADGLRPVKIIRDNKEVTTKNYIPFKHKLLVLGDIIFEDGISKFLLKKNDIDGKVQ